MKNSHVNVSIRYLFAYKKIIFIRSREMVKKGIQVTKLSMTTGGRRQTTVERVINKRRLS